LEQFPDPVAGFNEQKEGKRRERREKEVRK